MKKHQVLFKLFMLSLVVVPVICLCSVLAVQAQKEEKKVPMELNGTQWDVKTMYVTAKGKKDTSTDVLIFKDKKFISESFEGKGYEPTNYSMTLEEDGTTRFGTMQIKGKETSFWKGKVKGNTIDGSVHTQFANGGNQTTYFSGDLTSGELKLKVESKPKFPKPTPTPPPPAPVKVEPKAPVGEVGSQVGEEKSSAEVVDAIKDLKKQVGADVENNSSDPKEK